MSDLAIPKLINNENLEKVLRNKHNERDVKVKNFKISMGSKKGDNYTSDIYRVHIDYELNGTPKNTSVIAKYMIQREKADQMLEELKEKEREMYMRILPKYHEMTGVKFGADCYYITEDNAVFFLEDLKNIGFDVADRTLGLDLNHSKMLVEKLGKFHAASMVLYQQNPGIFNQFEEGIFKMTTEENSSTSKVLHSSVLLTLEVVRQWEGYEKIVKKLENMLDSLMERMLRCVQQPGRVRVLNHGDCWTNNMMFKYSGDSKIPEDVFLVDLQIGFYSSMAMDFNYFFYSSLKQEVRDNFEEVLIESYHKSLTESLMKFKYSKIPSLDDVKKDIKDFQFYGEFYLPSKQDFTIFAASCVLPASLMERNENLEYNVKGFESTESEFRKIQYRGKSFQAALKKILLKFDKDGTLD